MQIFLKDAEPILVEAVVRVVPQQRVVVRGTWRDAQGVTHQVYAKKFTGKRAYRHFQRDLAGVRYLSNANILTPPLLSQGLAGSEGMTYVAVFSAIEDAQNAEEVWVSLSGDARFDLAKRLVSTVAEMHRAGLLQTDLYLKNFLLQGDLIYTLDGDGIRPLPKFNEGQTCLRNLSALLSKFDVLELEKWLPQLLKVYGDTRCWQTLPRLALLQHLIVVHRSKTTNAYANKKVFRTCTDVQVSHKSNQYLAVVSAYVNSDLANVDVLDDFLQIPDFKNGNTCTVGLLTTKDAQKIVIKRYNVKSVWHGVIRSFRKTRAAISWANAHRLKLLGIATIQPVSLLEERFFFGRLSRRSYFLSEYLDGLDANVFFAVERDKVKREEVVKHIVELFYRLYLLNISHGDMKASNIKIVGNQSVLIDLDSMRQHRFGLIAKHCHARDLRRFMRNWQADETLTNAFKKVFKVVYADHQPLKLAHID